MTGECACSEFWRGPTCDNDIDECLNDKMCNSMLNSRCSNFPGGFECVCLDGFILDENKACIQGKLVITCLYRCIALVV